MLNAFPDQTGDLASAALNLVNCGLVVLDSRSVIVHWNRWMVARSGRSAARVEGDILFDVFPELRSSRVEEAVLAALEHGTAANVPRRRAARRSRCARPAASTARASTRRSRSRLSGRARTATAWSRSATSAASTCVSASCSIMPRRCGPVRMSTR
ncbi:PAS domain-containing protein [Massilia sp. Dwa41.01b]|uniref:PAS domain-containing protein n=1 Tax=Massilia sp. Dwa41.01b TaxID=2709302 RepID=UPI001E60BC45|nr:PAS domain-containing protein [Massilia sp. Dwa41.01b]